MILKSIRLKNIRSYTEQEIEFPEGAILLAGDIGSGKSSILHAVEFALFGARRDSISGEALLRKGERQGEVEVRFELEGKNISVKRTLRKQQDSVAQEAGQIIVDGIAFAGTATELKARMLHLLGYPKEMLTKSRSLVYRYTVYTPQEEMKQIIFDDTDSRVDTLRKVFGIDRYKRISENAALFVKSAKEKKRELAGMFVGLDEKRKEFNVKKAERDKSESIRKELLPLIDEVRKRKSAKKGEIQLIEKKIIALAELRKKSEVCSARMQELSKQRSGCEAEFAAIGEEVARIRKKLDATFFSDMQFPPQEQVENELESLEKQAAELARRKTELAEREKQMSTRIEELGRDITSKSTKTSVLEEKERLYKELLEEIKDKETVSRAIEGINSRLRSADAAVAELSAGRKNSESVKRQIAELSKCPTCRQDVSDFHKHSVIDEEERNIRKIQAELDALGAQRQEIQKMLEEHNIKLKELSEKERLISATRVELSNIQAINLELAQVRQLHAGLNREKLEIMSALGKLSQQAIDETCKNVEYKKQLLKEMNSYQLLLREKKHNLQLIAEKEQRKEALVRQQDTLSKEILLLENEKKHVSEEIFRNGSLEQFYRQEKEELDKLLEEEKKLEVRLGEAGKEIEGIGNALTSLSKDIAEQEKALSRYDYLNSVQEWIECMFLNLMTTMEKQVMARAHTLFSELFSMWFGMLIEDESISVRIDDTFSPVVTQNGYDTDTSHLSGGEKTSIALAYRLALNKVVNDIMSGLKTKDLLILDEPTDGFSYEQLDKVRNVLDELNMKQTIIVSHEAKIESFVDHVIRIHKTEHVSRVVS